jgi:hypothetical protein
MVFDRPENDIRRFVIPANEKRLPWSKMQN